MAGVPRIAPTAHKDRLKLDITRTPDSTGHLTKSAIGGAPGQGSPRRVKGHATR